MHVHQCQYNLNRWLLSLVVGIAPGLNNLSLQLNSVGFYTVAKLMVVPCIVAIEFFIEGKELGTTRAWALIPMAFGVGIATIR